jgi:CubicO group peptidase (beta-lactamase class C family)
MLKIRSIQFAALLVVACLSSAASAAELPSTAREKVENGLRLPISTPADKPMRLTDRMAHYQVPAVSIAVIANGKIKWAQAYGLRQVEPASPVTVDTLFQAASISKPISAMAALALVEQGKLNLDGDINVHLQSWKIPSSNFTANQAVSLRSILTHRSGLSTWGFAGYARDAALPTLRQVLDGAAPANSDAVRSFAAPGKDPRYSGGGFTVMQQAMIDVSGKNYSELLNTLVLKPTGMAQSGFQARKDGENIAFGYVDAQPVKGGYHLYPELAAAGLWTTPSDLARFIINLQEISAGKKGGVISPDLARKMLTATDDGWGLGIRVDSEGKQAYFNHRGANEGFQCYFVGLIGSRSGAVVMTNGSGGYRLAEEIMRSIAADEGWPVLQGKLREIVDVPAATLQNYEGFYDVGGQANIYVSVADGKLVVRKEGTPWVVAPAASMNRFYVDEIEQEVSFVGPEKGAAASLILHSADGTQQSITRAVAPAPVWVAAMDNTPIYLRGSMNDWSTANRFYPQGIGKMTATITLKKGRYEFKIASEDYKKVNFGGSPVTATTVLKNEKTTLWVGGNNLLFDAESDGEYVVIFDGQEPSTPKVSVITSIKK